MSNQQLEPFAPSTTTPGTSSPSLSKRDVTIPALAELHDSNFLDRILPPPKTIPGPAPKKAEGSDELQQGSAFMAALNEAANRQLTQNMAAAYASTLLPTLDAFNGLSQATNVEDYERLLKRSWEEDPKTTVQIIFNLRSIHEGKSEREGFYRAWGWLYREHPRTAIANLQALVQPLIPRPKKEKKDKEGKDKAKDVEEDMILIDLDEPAEDIEPRGLSHGYWKDLLNLLVLAAEGNLNTNSAQFTAIHRPRIEKTADRSTAAVRGGGRRGRGRGRGGSRGRGRGGAQASTRPADESGEAKPPKEERIKASEEYNAEKAKAAGENRDQKHSEWKVKVDALLQKSPSFKALYITVARLFADGLAADLKLLNRIADPQTAHKDRIDAAFQISLCAKYAPSISGAHDRVTNIPTAIAEILAAEGHLKIQAGISSGSTSLESAQILRSVYTRWGVSPLRRFLQIPEIYMSARKWSELPYNRVPSLCMQKNKKIFYKHDEERFSKYLQDVATGKASISGATLLPHTLLDEAMRCKEEVDRKVIEAQWNTMIETLKASGALENSIAVCDVSGSMGSIHSGISGKHVSPILPAVSLSIVLAQIARPPWNNTFITFSATPQVEKINPADGLVSVARYMVGTNWGMNTDFNAVFTKLLLPMAVEAKLPKEEMIKRLFVFSDMEFDQSTTTRGAAWETEHQKVVKAFEAAGYDIPEIVYWNLQGARGAKPVTADEKSGVSLMSGFSPNMMKVFMDGGDDVEEIEVVEEEGVGGQEGEVVVKKVKQKMTPEQIMRKALDKPSYATLVVLD